MIIMSILEGSVGVSVLLLIASIAIGLTYLSVLFFWSKGKEIIKKENEKYGKKEKSKSKC